MFQFLQRIGLLFFVGVSIAGFWYAGARSLKSEGDKIEVSWLIPVNDMKNSYENLAATFRKDHP